MFKSSFKPVFEWCGVATRTNALRRSHMYCGNYRHSDNFRYCRSVTVFSGGYKENISADMEHGYA
jgi:hypothetical protein